MPDGPRVLVVYMGPARPLAEALRDLGLDAHVVEPRSVDLGQFGGQVRCDGPGAVPVWPRRPYVYALFGWGLVRRLLDLRPDVVFCAGEPSELGVAQAVLLTRWLLPEARVVLYSYENVNRRWRSLPGRLRGWLLRAVLRRVDAVAVASRSAERVLYRQGLPPGRAEVLGMWADDAQYSSEARAWRPRAAGETRLLFAGRLVPEKGVDLLLRSLARLPAGVTLTLAGDGPSAAELRALASDLGLGRRVTFAGRLGQAELASAMRESDLLVLPSRATPTWQEQFGVVAAQAMLCGTPVLGSRTGAIPEVIGAGGWCFRDGDLEDLIRLLASLTSAPEALAERGQRAARWARRQYAFGAYVRRLSSLLRRC